MTNRQPKAAAPTTPPPPKHRAAIGHVASGAMGKAAAALLAFVSNPAAMQLWRDLEECREQAKAAGVEQSFEDFWEYELERAKELPGHALTPKAVLQLALKLDRK